MFQAIYKTKVISRRVSLTTSKLTEKQIPRFINPQFSMPCTNLSRFEFKKKLD